MEEIKDSVNSQITDAIEHEVGKIEDKTPQEGLEPSEPPAPLQEPSSEIPPGAIAEMRRKAREKYLAEGRELGRQEALLALQKEYEEALKSSERAQKSPSNTPAEYKAPQGLIQEASWVEKKGLEKYPGKFDPKTKEMVDSFESVVLSPVNHDPCAQRVAAEILKGEYPFNKEDVLYQVFSDPHLMDDLRDLYNNPPAIQRRVQKYLWKQSKPKAPTRPANPPLSDIKPSLSTERSDKELTLKQRLELYRKSSLYSR